MEWWKKSVVYQIYPLSFKDSNGDGIGDIRGMIEKLDYLKELGVDVIWSTPLYNSPMDDNGYDISDYYSINPLFGKMSDFEEFLSEVHKRDMKLIMDLVVNHTSDEHIWFKEAIENKNSKYRDFYIFSETKATNQESIFSGSVWEFNEEANSYYYHLFSKRQPDLNWENKEMREEIYRMINWWLDKGIDGFRLDVIDFIGKDPWSGTMNFDKTHEYLQEMHEKCFKGRDILTVGETPYTTPETAPLYSLKERNELSMVFGFEFIGLDEVKDQGKWELKKLKLLELKEVISKWQIALHNNGWNSLFWSNHDQPRIVSRYGNDTEYREKSAKMLATLLHGLQGTPYIYQGEEIGMTNIKLPLNKYKDVETINMVKEKIEKGWTIEKIMEGIYAKGRDNARTPIQWDNSEYAGFSSSEPWLEINSNYKEINVKNALEDKNSIFYYYQKLLRLRKDHEIIVNGDYQLLFKDNEKVFAYLRTMFEKELLVICNFYQETTVLDVNISEFKLLISNYDDVSAENNKLNLRPYEAMILLKE